MAVEHIVRRTIWVAKCPTPDCDWSIEVADNPPRERQCPNCDTWVPFVALSAESPEYRGLKK